MVKTYQTAIQPPPRGLSGEEAKARLSRYGPNALPEKPPQSLWRRLGSQFRSPLIYILLFALGLDRDPGVLRERPRDPRAPLLDATSLRFILVTGVAKALVGGSLLVMLPRYGYGPDATRTLLFLYVAVGQLVFAYPSRRTGAAPRFNLTLHLSVVFGTVLQLLTVLLPGLPTLLGLEYPGLLGLAWVAAAITLSWAAAET